MTSFVNSAVNVVCVAKQT